LPDEVGTESPEFLRIDASRTTVARVVSTECAREIVKRLAGAPACCARDIDFVRPLDARAERR